MLLRMSSHGGVNAAARTLQNTLIRVQTSGEELGGMMKPSLTSTARLPTYPPDLCQALLSLWLFRGREDK